VRVRVPPAVPKTKKKKMKKEKTSKLKFQYNWKSHMKSLILFMEMGNDDNRKFAKEELMKLAEKLDNYNYAKQETV
tara:strand:- start:930 stop:1157 length:228 start_codon:yes stop_codon:yes gene_type:complete